MHGIIDFHAHAFPDHIAATAIPHLEREGNVTARSTGTVADLLAAMDRAGVEKSVLGSIATKPAQFEAILAWSGRIRSERLVPFPSFHPADPDWREHLRRIQGEGFRGVKMHPYYQDFHLDEARLLPMYEELCRQELILLMHTGFDIAFPRLRLASPDRIVAVADRFPELKLVTSHLGAWEQWDEVEELLMGRPIYMDISYTLDQIDRDQARRILTNHPPGYLLFGTDSPWADQAETLELLRGLDLGEELERRITRENGRRLLDGD